MVHVKKLSLKKKYEPHFPPVGTSEEVILVFFFMFFRDLCDKRHIFLCLFDFFAHYYW